jgi:hypothetical protein
MRRFVAIPIIFACAVVIPLVGNLRNAPNIPLRLKIASRHEPQDLQNCPGVQSFIEHNELKAIPIQKNPDLLSASYINSEGTVRLTIVPTPNGSEIALRSGPIAPTDEVAIENCVH